MNTSTFFIYSNYYLGYFVAIFAFANLLWLLEMSINAVVQKKELNDALEFPWKGTLIWAWILGLLGVGMIYLPALGTRNFLVSLLGIGIYIVAIFAYSLQFFFMWDYHRQLQKYLERAWFMTSCVISELLALASAVSVLLFMITYLLVTNY